MMSAMTTLDWQALATEIKRARLRLGMRRQLDLADAAGVSEATIGKLEAGGGKFTEVPLTLPQVSEALGWTAESGRDVLLGGKPTPAPRPDPSTASPPPAPDAFAEGMPLRLRQELRQGHVVDADITEVQRPGSSSRFLLIWKTEAERQEVSPEDLAEWTRVQRALRGLPVGPSDDSPGHDEVEE